MEDNKFEAEQLFIEANGYYSKGDHNEAIKILRKIEQDFPDYKSTYSLLGRLYRYVLYDQNAAEGYYKKALSLDPGYRDILYEYASLLHGQHRYIDLEQLVKRNMKSDPSIDKSLVYEYLGIISEYYKRYSEAINFYKKCLTFTTSNQNYEYYLQMIDRCKQKRNPLRVVLNKENRIYTWILYLVFISLILFQIVFLK